MNYFITLACLVAMSIAQADTVEIRTGEGYRESLHTVQGTYKSKYASEFPYVCYDKRIKVVSEGETYVSYKGCTRIDVRCQSTGRVHFGKYPNDYKAHQALQRCRNSRPKFISS